MSSVVINGDTSGSITLQAPAVAGTNTLTLPALTGTVLTSTSPQSSFPSNIAGNGPAFSAYANASQSLTTSTWTKIQFQTEEFDTANCYDNSTNYRFTPNVAGYYQVNAELDVYASGSAISAGIIAIYKNGSVYKRGFGMSGSYTEVYPTVSALVYLNGSTDYVEIYATYASVGSISVSGSSNFVNYFQASMVRAA